MGFKYTSHKCEPFSYCYVYFVFELAYKLNISMDGHNCRNSCHKIGDQELFIECLSYGVRYFLRQYMRPFKLYLFFDEINQ